MSEDKGQETIREDYNKTILEGQSQRRETLSLMAGSKFRDYQIVEQLPSSSTEADIFIIEKDGSQFFLKLYRSGIDPKIDILKSVKALGEKYPKSFIKIFETDFDSHEKRWFEVQEYVKSGSLQAVIDKLPQASEDERKELFSGVAHEAGEALNILHENGFLHRDVKPSNILVRSLNPLNLVVIDFGIASALESDMSKKATRLGGTPMYQSPESFSSVADETTGERRVILGPPTDWWGLGMILLEIASGSHPFKNLSPNVIGYSLVTEAVSIPDKLDEGQKELLHGLLTRNPAKRWSWEQVSRWLKGERGIPHFFEETAEREDSSKHPLTFMHQKYRTLEEVVAAFTRDEESWKRGREFLLRGNVRQWLESNLDFDTALDLDNALADISDSDEKLFSFINTYGRNIPFVFGGHAVTVKNLFIFTAKAQKREAMTDMERKIVDMLLDGRLISRFRSYLDGKNSVSDDEKTFMSMLERFKGKNLSNVSAWLDFYINPKKYHCPFLKDTSSPEKIIRESDSLNLLPMTLDEWNQINNGFIVPSDIIERMKSAATYNEAVSKAVYDIKSMKLIQRGSYTDREVEIIRVLLPSLKTEESIRKVLDFCVHPEKYYCPFVKDTSSQEQVLEAAIILSVMLGELPMTKAEWDNLTAGFILPEKLLRDIESVSLYDMESANLYRDAVAEIKRMKSDNLLFYRRDYTHADDATKSDLASSSIEDYKRAVYRVRWGYDDANVARIESSLSEMRKKQQSSSGFKAEQCGIWVAYLEYLSSRSSPLTDEDKKILRNVSLKNTDELEKRITAIVG